MGGRSNSLRPVSLAGPGSRGPLHSAGRCLWGPYPWVLPNEVASIFYEEQVILFSQIKTGKGGRGGRGEECGGDRGEGGGCKNSFPIFLPSAPLLIFISFPVLYSAPSLNPP